MKYSFIYRSAGGSFETVRAALKTNEASLSLIRVISSSNIGEFESRVHCRVSEALLNKRRGENLGNLFSVSRILGIIITIKECRNSAHGRGRVVTLDGNGWFVTKTGEIVSFPSLERINPKSISSVGEIRGERERELCPVVVHRWKRGEVANAKRFFISYRPRRGRLVTARKPVALESNGVNLREERGKGNEEEKNKRGVDYSCPGFNFVKSLVSHRCLWLKRCHRFVHAFEIDEITNPRIRYRKILIKNRNHLSLSKKKRGRWNWTRMQKHALTRKINVQRIQILFISNNKWNYWKIYYEKSRCRHHFQRFNISRYSSIGSTFRSASSVGHAHANRENRVSLSSK